MFQKLSWVMQLVAGIALFGISFFLQGEVLAAFLGSAALAFSLTAALEVSKALTIVLYRIMQSQHLVSYPASVRFLVLGFRVALVFLSALCSVMYLAHKLDRPHLEATRTADLASLEREYAVAIDRLSKERQEAEAQLARRLRERYQRLVQPVNERYRTDIRELERALNAEMDNAVGGKFAGPRYRELAERLKNEKDAYEHQLTGLAEAEALESRQGTASFTERYRAAKTQADADYRQRRQSLTENSYIGDPRVENPVVYAFLSVVHTVLGVRLEPLELVFFFSLFISLIIELGILVAFENLTLAQLPVFTAEHQVAVHLGQKRVATAGELRGFEIDEALKRGKVSKRRGDAEQRMDEALADALP